MTATDGPEDPGLPADIARRERLRQRVYTLDQLLETPSEQARPLLGDFLRVGEVTILGGHGGQGKSTMSLEMVHAVATGGSFLGAESNVGRVIVVDLEQGIGIAQRAVLKAFYPKGFKEGVPAHLLAKGLDFSGFEGHVHWCDWREGAGPDGWDDIFHVLGELIEETEPDLVLLDPVYKLMLGRSSKDDEVVGHLIHTIDNIRTRHPDVAWLIPMHPRKPPAGGNARLNMFDLYGAAIWSWWASLIFVLWRGANRTTTFRIEKDRMANLQIGEEWELVLREDNVFERTADDAKDEARNATDRVWRFLQEDPGRAFTRAQIGSYLAIAGPTVIKATSGMEKHMRRGTGYRELVVESGEGRTKLYSFTPPPPDPILDGVKAELNAIEDGEW